MELVSLYMLMWDRKFLKKCEHLGIDIYLYKRYVDNTLQVMRVIECGWEYCEKREKLIYKKEGGKYDELEDDMRTMSVMRDIANSIDKDIKMTFDTPSQNGRRLPVLDLEVWMEGDICGFSFLKKKVATPFCVLYTSAIPAKVKRETRGHEET